jgi:hypothetical protein
MRNFMETYNIVHGNGGWTIKHNGAQPEGEYATREGALEAVYLAASNDIKKGLAITIKIDAPAPGEAAMGGPAT